MDESKSSFSLRDALTAVLPGGSSLGATPLGVSGMAAEVGDALGSLGLEADGPMTQPFVFDDSPPAKSASAELLDEKRQKQWERERGRVGPRVSAGPGDEPLSFHEKLGQEAIRDLSANEHHLKAASKAKGTSKQLRRKRLLQKKGAAYKEVSCLIVRV
jgi:hypothetical protein